MVCSSLEFLYVIHICLGCIAPLPSQCAFMNARPIEILLLGGLQAIEELRHCFPRIHAIPRFYTSILEGIMIDNLKRNGCLGYWKYAQIKEVNLDVEAYLCFCF